MSVFRTDYVYAADSTEGRNEVRPSHRAWLASLDGSEQFEGVRLIAAGPLGEEEAMLVLTAPDSEAVHTVLQRDPFAEAGYVDLVTVREWTPAVGELAHLL